MIRPSLCRRRRPGRSGLVATLLLAGAGATRLHAEEPVPSERARVALAADAPQVVVGEPVRLTLRVSYEAAWFEAHALPLSPQRVSVPLYAESDAFRARNGLAPLLAAPAPCEAVRLALGDELRDACLLDGALPGALPGWRTLEVARWVVFQAPGEVAFEAPVLRFAHAERFRADALGGRVPEGVRTERVRGAALTLSVRPLPAPAPAGFGGLVGALALRAEADAVEVESGATLNLTLTLSGAGNQELVDTPRPARLAAFLHVVGLRDERTPFGRRVVFEVRPLNDDLREIPALELPVFDPAAGAYRTLATQPLPLTVRRAAGAAATGPAPVAGPGSTGPGLPGWFWPAVAALLALLVRTALRRRTRLPASPEPQARLGAALAAFRAAEQREEDDLAEPLGEVLAARLGCPPAAVIASDRDLAARLTREGVAPALAEEAARALRTLVEARYAGLAGGAARSQARSAAQRVCAALEAQLGARGLSAARTRGPGS